MYNSGRFTKHQRNITIFMIDPIDYNRILIEIKKIQYDSHVREQCIWMRLVQIYTMNPRYIEVIFILGIYKKWFVVF